MSWVHFAKLSSARSASLALSAQQIHNFGVIAQRSVPLGNFLAQILNHAYNRIESTKIYIARKFLGHLILIIWAELRASRGGHYRKLLSEFERGILRLWSLKSRRTYLGRTSAAESPVP